MPGDVNREGTDPGFVFGYWGGSDTDAAANNDRIIIGADISIVLGNWIDPECLHQCSGDLDGEDIVDGADLSILLGDWNQSDSNTDIDQSGLVDGADLAALLGAWCACP